VVAVHGPRAAGSSPLALWLTRADATVPVDVTVHLLDPAGRLTEQVITVPAGGEAPPPQAVDSSR
jgi:hypothetical protein